MPIAKIRKRDGRVVDFDSSRIRDAIHRAFIAVELGDGERAEAVTEGVVKLLEERFKEKIPSVEDAQDLVIEVLKRRGYGRVAEEYQAYRRRKDELRRLREKLGILEPKLTVNALEVLKRRYLLRDETGRVVETPSRMFTRVAKAISRVDANYGESPKESEKTFYGMMARLEFLPNSPTLFNAGTELGQLSACFVLPVEDSLRSIFKAVMDMALIEQSGGGVGFDFSKLRPKGDVVKSTRGVASGPVSFMRVFDMATNVIKAGGKRRGAMMGILRVDHPDIIEFVTAKRKPGALSNFNISVSVTDDFMKKVEEDEEYWLVNPRSGSRVKKLRAKDVWALIAESAWESGDPGVVFMDEVNRHNPTPEVGRIEATNPCIPSYTWIMTEDGPKQVGDLIGKKFTAIVDGEKWSSTTEGFFPTGVRPVYRLITEEGFELCLTKDHLVMKLDKIARHKVEARWVRAEELKEGDKILLSNHATVDSWNGKYSFKEGYLMGLIIGGRPLPFQGDEKERREIIGEPARAENPPPNPGFKGRVRVNGALECRAPSLKKLMEELGLRPGEKAITSSMEKASSDFCKGIIKGLFDSNGFVRINEREGVSVRLAQNNIEVLKAVQRTLLRFGIYSEIRFSNGLPPNEGSKEPVNNPQRELVIPSEDVLRFSQKIGFRGLDGEGRLQNFPGRHKEGAGREHFAATVKEMVFQGVEPTYDVKIPGKNAFDANGFYVHNCGEQPLLPYESCNLGSINLSRMVEDGEINWEKLKETVRNAVHFLDNVIDANKFPLKEIEQMTKANRKIGLGVMGFADMLIKLGIPYNSERALALAEKLMEFVTNEARRKSVELGEERGSFPNFDKSVWKDRYQAMRNATVTTIAPTGSISIIAGCSSGIEPLFAISFIRNVLGGRRLFEINPLFELTAKQRGFYSAKLLEEIARTGSVQKIDGVPDDVKEVFVTALDIPPEWHVKMQTAFQKHTDNAVSKTVNLPYEATVEDVRKVFKLAWRLKCKGVTVFRYGSKPEQVLYIGEVKAREKKFIAAESEYAGGCPTKTCPFPG